VSAEQEVPLRGCRAAVRGRDGNRDAPRARRAVAQIEGDGSRRGVRGGRVGLPLHLHGLRLIAKSELFRQAAGARGAHARNAHRHAREQRRVEAVDLPIQRYASVGAKLAVG